MPNQWFHYSVLKQKALTYGYDILFYVISFIKSKPFKV